MFIKKIFKETIDDEYKEYLKKGEGAYAKFLKLIMDEDEDVVLQTATSEYEESLYYVLDFFDNNYKEEQSEDIESNNKQEIFTKEDLYKDAPRIMKILLEQPKPRDIVYIDSSKSMAHFHFQNGMVTLAENINQYSHLRGPLQSVKANRIYEDLTFEELDALLRQMGFNLDGSEFELEFSRYSLKKETTLYMYYTIILGLLKDEDRERGIKKATLFKKMFNFYFDLSPYKDEIKKPLKRDIKLKPLA